MNKSTEICFLLLSSSLGIGQGCRITLGCTTAIVKRWPWLHGLITNADWLILSGGISPYWTYWLFTVVVGTYNQTLRANFARSTLNQTEYYIAW